MTEIGYITTSELQEYLHIPDDRDALHVRNAIAGATMSIDGYCGRTFGKSATATPLLFEANDEEECHVDDFWTVDGIVLEVDDGDNGTFTSLWTYNVDYIVEPANGLGPNGHPWPFTEICAVRSRIFPLVNRRDYCVRLTAKWGWPEIPADVVTASYQLAAQNYEMRNNPMGGSAKSGLGTVNVRDIPELKAMLEGYKCGAGAGHGPLVA